MHAKVCEAFFFFRSAAGCRRRCHRLRRRLLRARAFHSFFFSSLCCFTANPLTVAFLSPVQFRSPVASWRTLHSSAEQSVKRKNRPTNVVPCQTKFMFAHQRCRAKTKNRLLCKVDATRTRMRAKNDFTSSFVISLSLSHHR